MGSIVAATKSDPGLMVIVPPSLPSRASTLSAALAGSDIQVLVDRRRGERRRARQTNGPERRQDDRRSAPRVVAYVYACPVVAVASPSAVAVGLS